MRIREFNSNDINDVVKLLNTYFEDELVYKQFNEESFKSKFLDNPNFCNECTFVAIDGGQLIGFGSGLYKKQLLQTENKSNPPGFITMILVDQNYRKKGIGSQLLKEIEKKLYQNGCKRIDCSFFNPINLEWIIPNTNNHSHPNAPGVVYPSPSYDFFLKHGYKAVAKQNSYYLNLDEFTITDYINERIDSLKDKGILFEYFDSNKHDFKDLFDQLGNEYWRSEITSAINKDDLPVLVPVYQNTAIGFTGPLYVQEDGRGYFAGIGIHPDYRSYGAGKTLFFLLCQQLKELGASYMTLFTGENNPARRMYEAAEFKIVKSWYVMRKETNDGE